MKKKDVIVIPNQIVSKGLRLRPPKTISLQLRPEVYDWLCCLSDELHCAVGVLARGILEDAFDKASASSGNDEVSV